jgi:hypothetical protein
MNRDELTKLAERAEQIGLNLTFLAFFSPTEWDPKALASAANGFTVAAALRSLASRENR